jgi:phage gpG-like protein
MANAVTVKVIKLEDHFKEVLRAASGEQLQNAAKAGGRTIESYAKINVEKTFSKKATQNLAGSIKVFLASSTETKAEVDVGPTVVYGRIHELGGLIKPVFAKFLHFVIDGVHISTKLVHMPARPYLRPAVDEHMDEILDAVGYHLKKKITEACG